MLQNPTNPKLLNGTVYENATDSFHRVVSKSPPTTHTTLTIIRNLHQNLRYYASCEPLTSWKGRCFLKINLIVLDVIFLIQSDGGWLSLDWKQWHWKLSGLAAPLVFCLLNFHGYLGIHIKSVTGTQQSRIMGRLRHAVRPH